MKISPEFMDIFGFIGFLFITYFSVNILRKNKVPNKWLTIVLLIIGILGIVIDGFIVYNYYLK